MSQWRRGGHRTRRKVLENAGPLFFGTSSSAPKPATGCSMRDHLSKSHHRGPWGKGDSGGN